jgi:hypothetical protein
LENTMNVRNIAVQSLGAIVALSALSLAPASAADQRICGNSAALEPQGAIATTWYRLGGAQSPLGCPTSPGRDGRQAFEHGSIAQAKNAPNLTLATYLRDGRIHVSVTSLGQAVPRYQVAVERSEGPTAFWNFGGGTSSTLVADLPEGTRNDFHVKLYPCEVSISAFTTAALVCDRSEAATAVSSPLELAMDPTSPRVNPTGAVALRK